MNEFPLVPSPQDPEMAERKRLAALAESALKFRRAAADALDSIICEMILANGEIGFGKFETPGGRPCVILLGVGSDPVGAITDYAYRITNGEEDEST